MKHYMFYHERNLIHDTANQEEFLDVRNHYPMFKYRQVGQFGYWMAKTLDLTLGAFDIGWVYKGQYHRIKQFTKLWYAVSLLLIAVGATTMGALIFALCGLFGGV